MGVGLPAAAQQPGRTQAPEPALPPAAAAPAQRADPHPACVAAVEARLPPRPRAVLPQLTGTGRRLLAARAYVRFGDLLPSRWSWTAAEIAAWGKSPERARALAEVEKVATLFAARHPPYSLWANTEARSLEIQIERWNVSASVAAAADALMADAPGGCDPAEPSTFVRWLEQWEPPVRPTMAAPGVSPHGRGRAYDFQVMLGSTLVAGTETARIQSDWVDSGWAEKLANAVRDASPAFEGPLAQPNEPWHFAFHPERLDASAGSVSSTSR
jgi:hypothetical protein